MGEPITDTTPIEAHPPHSRQVRYHFQFSSSGHMGDTRKIAVPTIR